MSLVIETHDLKRDYLMGDSVVNALKGVSIKIKRGEFVALMGPSGSGKSTLMHLLGCLDRPSDGVYFLEGQNTRELKDISLAHLRNHYIGFVFQSFNLLPRMTALENVGLPLLYSPTPDQWEKRAKHALERVGLKQRIYHQPVQLSGGERQRVAIARALVTVPSLILADEPTGNLDSARGKEIMKLLCELVKEGRTLVMVTHDVSTAAYADRVIHLKDGLIATQEDSDEVG
jgi:putative ABC transport system ATP-binding protein